MEFTSKTSKNGAVNLLFKSFVDAVKVKDILDEKLSGCNVMKPVMGKMKRYDFVGVPYEISKEDAALSLVNGNKNLSLELCADDNSCVQAIGSPNFRMKIIDGVKCNSGWFRLKTRVSPLFEKAILKNKLKILRSVLHSYEVPKHDMCFRCQDFGHIANECNGDVHCGKCSGSHRTSE